MQKSEDGPNLRFALNIYMYLHTQVQTVSFKIVYKICIITSKYVKSQIHHDMVSIHIRTYTMYRYTYTCTQYDYRCEMCTPPCLLSTDAAIAWSLAEKSELTAIFLPPRTPLAANFSPLSSPGNSAERREVYRPHTCIYVYTVHLTVGC